VVPILLSMLNIFFTTFTTDIGITSILGIISVIGIITAILGIIRVIGIIYRHHVNSLASSCFNR